MGPWCAMIHFFFYDISLLLLIDFIFDNQLVGYANLHMIAFTLVLCYNYLMITVPEHSQTLFPLSSIFMTVFSPVL